MVSPPPGPTRDVLGADLPVALDDVFAARHLGEPHGAAGVQFVRDLGAQLIVLAIRKRQDVFPEMITLGRTANNDMVLNDATISKFHAFFRQIEDRWEVVDVGSRNGTKVMGRPLVARQPAVVVPGTRIRFGTVDLTFHNAREAWDALRRV